MYCMLGTLSALGMYNYTRQVKFLWKLYGTCIVSYGTCTVILPSLISPSAILYCSSPSKLKFTLKPTFLYPRNLR